MKESKRNKRKIGMADFDINYLCNLHGKEKAIEIMRLANALHKESDILIGRKKAPPDS